MTTVLLILCVLYVAMIVAIKYFYNRLRKKIRKCESKLCTIKEPYYTMFEQLGNELKKTLYNKHSYAGDYFVIVDKKTTVGKFCSIADNVTLGTTFHPTDRLSTHPFTYFNPSRISKKNYLKDFVYHKPVKVGNDVWIGKHVTVMDGITVGDGAIIGTNAVVTKDVPPYAIIVGVPARIIKYRFDESTIKDLLRLKWWDLDDETIADLPFCDISACVEKLKQIRGEK